MLRGQAPSGSEKQERTFPRQLCFQRRGNVQQIRGAFISYRLFDFQQGPTELTFSEGKKEAAAPWKSGGMQTKHIKVIAKLREGRLFKAVGTAKMAGL